MNRLFNAEACRTTESRILALLTRGAADVVSPSSLSSPRAVGDAVQSFLEAHLAEFLPSEAVSEVRAGRSRRSMEDMAFRDRAGAYYAVDVKTHNVATAFNRPNLISVQRLADFYRNDANTFLILQVDYRIDGDRLRYEACRLCPIEHLSWNCLTLGALGWGQIQLADANRVEIDPVSSRREWMLQLCEKVLAFYGAEMEKIRKRGSWFKTVRRHWLTQPAAHE